MSSVRVLPGQGPGPRLRRALKERESCFVRFAQDPEAQVWVCARMGGKVYSTALAADEEWVSGVL